MENKVRPAIEKPFGDLIDPRIDWPKLRGLINIPVIAICTVVMGADNRDDVEDFTMHIRPAVGKPH